jgi:peptidoglycan/xylan/chitin deacetylase (PgdA/CDA1 family)
VRSARVLALLFVAACVPPREGARSSAPAPGNAQASRRPESKSRAVPRASANIVAVPTIVEPGLEPSGITPSADAAAETRPRFRYPVVSREASRVLVLLYHGFGDVASDYNTPPSLFARQIEWLAGNVDIIAVSELARFLEGEIELPARSVVITIDDGLASAYTRAFPILKRHDARFAIGVPTALLERWHEDRAIGWRELREMVDSGLCEIASHSDGHKDLVRLREDLVERELERSRRIIVERMGIRPEAFFYPYGNHDPNVQRMTQIAGYRTGFGITANGSRLVHAATPRWAIPRQAIDGKTSPGRIAQYFEG